ncbi:uncharacterized protein LOC108219453 isoform X2 [Daucus carota subsp. sativus]|uniref:uncharacterized protein LOC108219453 isoform X2 n=1 Tax=Daucus carota subsp. sativus TaxID=79200 RepID=UPI0007EFCCD5|nr:PREDICTED: uncharacterized protein LOC108219453 isoform X2 [Daucus carota subsp. sativus]
MRNWELKKCCNHEQVVFITTISVCTVVILAVEGIQVHADEGGSTQTRGGVYWFILPAGYLGSSFWGMVLILASTNLLAARIGAGCLVIALIIVLLIAKNWTLRALCIGFIVFIAIIWVLQETTDIRVLRYVILFIGENSNSSLFLSNFRISISLYIFRLLNRDKDFSCTLWYLTGVMNSLFSVYDIYDDLISRRVNISDAEKFAEVCPCPCNGVGWGVIWGIISFIFLCGAMYLGLVILS